eukprot:1940327-Pyramimonas_sp.AAC.1
MRTNEPKSKHDAQMAVQSLYRRCSTTSKSGGGCARVCEERVEQAVLPEGHARVPREASMAQREHLREPRDLAERLGLLEGGARGPHAHHAVGGLLRVCVSAGASFGPRPRGPPRPTHRPTD